MFFWGGLLPIIAFTVIEEWYGPVWGTIAGLIFGAGEIIYEYRTQGKVSQVTLASNTMIFILGFISIWTQEGFWFKMQPALLTLAFAIWVIITSIQKKPLLLILSEKQNPNLSEHLKVFFASLNFRLGFFMLFIAAISAWAALKWTTESWALFKGIGTPILLAAYLLIEILFFRKRLKKYTNSTS